MSYVSPRDAAKHFGVSIKTLQRWDKAGKIKSIRTEGNHRRFYIGGQKDGSKFIYARVSSSKQKSDLARQVKFLKDKYPGYAVIEDIGSGINFKRKGFNSILDKLFENNISEVIVATPDRFCRFGFEFFENLFKRFGAKITVANRNKFRSTEQELAEDLLSIITVFTARHHGARKYTIINEDKNIPNKKAKKDI